MGIVAEASSRSNSSSFATCEELIKRETTLDGPVLHGGHLFQCTAVSLAGNFFLLFPASLLASAIAQRSLRRLGSLDITPLDSMHNTLFIVCIYIYQASILRWIPHNYLLLDFGEEDFGMPPMVPYMAMPCSSYIAQTTQDHQKYM